MCDDIFIDLNTVVHETCTNEGSRDGVADEQLTKKAQQRGRTLDRQSTSPAPSMSHARKRSRSISFSSTASVSTISTGRSLSPKRARRDSGDRYFTSQQENEELPRSPSRNRKRRRKSSSSVSESRSVLSSTEERQNGVGRRRRRTVSPEPRGRPTADRRGSHRSRSRSQSRSVAHSRLARERKSMTPMPVTNDHPDHVRRRPQENVSFAKDERESKLRDLPSNRDFNSMREAPVRKKRSLSPYSKRIALTQAMNIGR